MIAWYSKKIMILAMGAIRDNTTIMYKSFLRKTGNVCQLSMQNYNRRFFWGIEETVVS